jgi:hypothetical protein
MAVTRIKNNQITDQTIIASAKISPGTIVDTLFAADMNISSNITVTGNFSVVGTTSTIQSVNTLVNDPLVVFNNGTGSTNTYDIGMVVNRYLNPKNAAWIWREANVGFAGILTSETGSTTGSINNFTYANLIIGNTIIDAYTVDSVSASTGAHQVRGGAAVSANLVVGGTGTSFGVASGTVRFDGNVPIVQVSQGATTRYGFMVVDTNSGTGAHTIRVSPTGTNIGTIGGTVTTSDGSSGGNDIFIQPGRLKSLWLNGSNAAIMADNNLNSTNPNVGAIVVTGSGGIGIGGNINVGTAMGVETQHITIQSARLNDIAIGKNTLKSGLSANVTIIGTMVGTTSVGVNATIYGAAAGPAAIPARATYLGKSAGNLATGSDSVYVGYNSGSLVTTGQYNVILGSYDGNVIASLNNQVVIADGQGAPRIRIDAGGNVFVVSGLDSTSSNIGAFVVQGGAGIGGNLNVGAAAAFASGRVMLDATQTSIVLAGNTATTYMSTDSVFLGQKIGSGTAFGAKTTIVGSEAAKTNTNGSEITLYGYRAGYTGAGQNTTAIGSQAGLLLQSASLQNQFFGYLAGSAVTTGDYNVVLGANTGSTIATLNNYVIISDGQGNEKIRATDTGSVYLPANITSTSYSTGTLVVQGGIASGGLDNNFLGNLTIGGNLWVLGGTTAIQSNVTVIEDSTIQLHTFGDSRVLNFNDNKDIGILSRYYLSSGAGGDRLAYFGWQNSTSNFVYIDAAAESAANVISGTYGNVQFGSQWLSNTTVSGSETSGALVVKGGIGVGQLSYINSVVLSGASKTVLSATGTDAVITLSPVNNGYVTISSLGARSTADNFAVGVTTPQVGFFTDLAVSSGTTPQGRNSTFSGNGFVSIRPTGNVVIYPSSGAVNTAPGNMDNMYIGNTTPRQASFTAATVGQDLKMSAFTANSALFISPASGNLSVDQSNENFNFQRATGNTFSGVSFSVGTGGDTATGTDTLNIRYQGDAYLPTAGAGLTTANTLGQSSGWTVSTSRGTGAAPVINQDGDFIGVFGAYNYSGGTAAYQEASAWRYVTQGTTAATSGIGGQAQLWTKQDNGASTLAMRVDANQISTFYGQVAIANTTTTTDSTTGALYVAGGMSAGGNIVIAQSARFNDTQIANRDFYVRGDKDATLIWASTSTYNQVIVGNNATATELVTGAKFQILSTDAFLLPRGSTAQQPGGGSGYGSPVAGMMRFNSTVGDMEYYDGASWIQPKSSAGVTVVTDDQFNGDGVTTDFTMTRGVTSNAAFVTLNGVLQTPTSAYNSFSGNALLRFTEAPAVGDAIDVRTVALTSTVQGISSPSGFNSVQTGTNYGVQIYTGETQANLLVTYSNVGTIQYSPQAQTVTNSPTIIAQFRTAQYRSAKLYINVDNGAGAYEVSEVMVIHDGTTAYRTQYNRIYTGAAALGSVTASITSGNVFVYYTGVAVSNTVKVRAEYLG